ncbi:S8 family peptidase [Xylaria digitata]|nr:S8 family peptidase [Xylaria digitata]
MAYTGGNTLALQLLASVALDAHRFLFPLAIANSNGLAAKIAIQLMFIAENVSKQELSRIPFAVQAVSTEALRDLLKISQEIRRTLACLFQDKGSKLQLYKSVTKFCQEPPCIVRPFESRFTQLSDLLKKNIPKSHRDLTDTADYSSPPPTDVYPDQVHKLLLDGVKNHSICMPEDWYITKLCLESGFRSEDQRVLFRIVTTTWKMTHWQELSFKIPILDTELKERPELQQDSKGTFDTSRLSLIRSGDACKDLDSPTFVELCIVEQKIKLSYTVARAFWQFYNSELMNVRWTSEDILLFRLDPDFLSPGESPEDILLRVFISFPFGDEYKEPPAEFYDQGPYIHRYPRILYLGIILLEIGLGQTLDMGVASETGLIEHTNRIHRKAELKLRELKNTKWDAFASKGYFDEAVENCLESFNFKETESCRRFRHQNDPSGKSHLSERRDAFYRKVVAPLFRLANIGFKDSAEPPLIRISNPVLSKPKHVNHEELQQCWDEFDHGKYSFLSGPSGSGMSFLDHLQAIARHITSCRRRAKTTKSIRVAILDTGYRKELPYFEDTRRSNRLRGWRDFTEVGSQSVIDTFGHGTFMARLLMHVAPTVDIYVIRVAENTEDLQNHEQHIVDAILHAGLDPQWEVDIISMSFGISNERKRECKAISRAIEKVTNKRNGSILFFAAAGNSGIGKENFPASHQDVISIYATNSYGTFLETNPSQLEHGPKLLGTYGTDIPSSIIEEIQTPFPQADLSAGSSIATVIAAGIAAMTLSYVAALPSLLNYKPCEIVCAKLYTKSGMERMLYLMSVLKKEKHHFINPIGFWREKEKDMDVFTAICAAVEPIQD